MKRWQTVVASVVTLVAVLSGTLALADTNGPGNSSNARVPASFDGTLVVRVYYPDQQTAHKIFISFEAQVLETNYKEGYHVMEVDQLDAARLAQAGLRVEMDTKWKAPPQVQLQAGITSIPGYPCYRTVEETFATAQDIVNDYPNLATWTDQGDSWEKTAGLGGYDMMVLTLTNSAIAGPKPKLFITAAIHAREYTTAELITRFAEYLVDNYGSDADATWLLDHHEIHLMLQTNPDGRKKAEAGKSWRKNTNQNYCGPTSDNRGADLNRNFSYQWGCCGGSSGNQCDSTYRGPSSASEPETQAVQNYVLAQFPDQRGSGETTPAPDDATGVYIDVHSYSELVLWPWGYTSTSTGNGTQLQTLGRKLAYWNGYTPEQAIGLYPTDGTTNDFVYGELGVAAYTFELGTAFFQSCSTFENTILPDNMPSLIYAAKVVRTPYMTPAGPDATDLALSLNPVPAGTLVTLSGTVNDTRYNNSNGTEPTQNVAAAEYYVDTPPWVSDPTPAPVAMSPSDGNFDAKIENVTATIDTTGWSEGRHIIFVRGQDTNGNWGAFSAIFLDITGGPTPTPTTEPPTPTPGPGPVFFDDFETDQGWITDPSGSDTASTGMWERANPEETSYSGRVYQQGSTVSGVYDLVTEGSAGSSVGSYDIDGGVTSIRSPDIVLPNESGIELSFSYYLAHYSNATADDYLRVKVVGSTTTTVFEELGSGDYDEAVWASYSTSLDAYAGQTIYLLIEAADGGGGSLVEAAVDDVSITSSGGPTPTPEPPTPTPEPPTPTSEPPTPTPEPPTPTPGPGPIFFDDFETSQGWTTDPSGTDTATTGMWERANPESTSYGGRTYQQGTTVSGVYDLVTEGSAGSSVGSYDIDGGVTSIRSPDITLPSGSGIELSFSYYLAHYTNATSADFLRVKVVGTTTTTVFEELGAGNYDEAVWDSYSTSLDAYAGQTIYLLIEAADGGGGSLVEAAIDDVSITAN